MRSMRRLTAVIGTVALLFGTAGPAFADYSYYWANVATANGYWGVDGYIRQSGLASLPTGEHHNVDLAICPAIPGYTGYFCGSDNIQTGEYQGQVYQPGHNLYSQYHVKGYWEYNSSYCPYDNGDFALSQSDTAFFIMYDGSGSHAGSCNGQPFTYYIFNVRKDCQTCAVIKAVDMTYSYGAMSAQSEIWGPISMPIGQDFTGCDSSMHCTDAGWGVHLYYGNGSWQLWNNDWTQPKLDSPPFYYAQRQYYWAWETCPSQC